MKTLLVLGAGLLAVWWARREGYLSVDPTTHRQVENAGGVVPAHEVTLSSTLCRCFFGGASCKCGTPNCVGKFCAQKEWGAV